MTPGTDPATYGLADGVSARHVVTVTLKGTADQIDASVLESLGGRVQTPSLRHGPSRDGLVEVVFTHDSDDLWLTLLTTMNVSWSTGYEPVEVTARVEGDRSPVA